MENDTLVAYIATERARGVTDDNIRAELLTKGWSEAEVLLALGGDAKGASVAPVVQVLPGIFALLKETKNTFMKSLQFFTIISLCLVLPMFLMTYVSDAAKSEGGFEMFGSSAVLMPLFVIFYVAVIILVTPTVFLALSHNELTDTALAFKKGSKKMGRYFLFSLANGFIIIAGFVLLIIPGILFAVWYTFVGIISVVDEETLSVSDALRRSKAYVKGRWWSIFWRMFAGSMSMYILYIIACFIVGLIFGFMHIENGVLNTLVASMMGGFYITATFIYNFVFYAHAKKLRA